MATEKVYNRTSLLLEILCCPESLSSEKTYCPSKFVTQDGCRSIKISVPGSLLASEDRQPKSLRPGKFTAVSHELPPKKFLWRMFVTPRRLVDQENYLMRIVVI